MSWDAGSQLENNHEEQERSSSSAQNVFREVFDCIFLGSCFDFPEHIDFNGCGDQISGTHADLPDL